MNGNFERDKGSYPYGRVLVGDDAMLYHVPTMQPVIPVRMPAVLAARAALRMNSKYYALRTDPKNDLDTSDAGVRKIVGAALTELVQEKLIDGVQATQIQLRLDAE